MSKQTDLRVCRYCDCRHPDKMIDLNTDEYTVVGKMYYHKDCCIKKRRGEWKDEQTKSDLQYIKNQWVLHINNTVVYSQLFKVLNDLLQRGIPSDYLVFMFDYIVSHKMKLRYPNGLNYYADNEQIKAAYIKSKIVKADKSAFLVDESAFGQPEQTPPPPQNNKPIGFESVLKNKKKD